MECKLLVNDINSQVVRSHGPGIAINRPPEAGSRNRGEACYSLAMKSDSALPTLTICKNRRWRRELSSRRLSQRGRGYLGWQFRRHPRYRLQDCLGALSYCPQMSKNMLCLNETSLSVNKTINNGIVCAAEHSSVRKGDWPTFFEAGNRSLYV